MSWVDLKTGAVVICRFCGIEHAIIDIRVYGTVPGFLLACGHRNAYCDSCKTLVEDASHDEKRVEPYCFECSP